MKKIEKILHYIESHGITEAEFERKAGISNGYLSNTAKRGADVTQKILDKIEKNLWEHFAKIFPVEAGGVLQEPTLDYEPERARSSLERTLENLSEDKLKSTAIIERLVALLERQLIVDPRLAPPGTPGTETLQRKKTSSKAG